MKILLSVILILISSSTYAFAKELTIDCSTRRACEETVVKMASSLDSEKSYQFMVAYLKITKSIGESLGPGEFKSREEADLYVFEAMRKKLHGKSYEQVVAMGKELPDDPQINKMMDDMKEMGTSSEYQHDADIVRLKHLKYLGGIIEEFKEKKGRYPLVTGSTTPNYVYIASPRQQRFTQDGPPFKHNRTDLAKFKKVLESGLGRRIDLPFDPQLIPVNKPNFYIYTAQGDGYFLAVHLHDGKGLGRKVAKYYYKAEIGSVAVPEKKIITYSELLSNEEFIERITGDSYSEVLPFNPEQADISLAQ